MVNRGTDLAHIPVIETIQVRPLQRPVYEDAETFTEFMEVNRSALSDWYDTLRDGDPSYRLDFTTFAYMQYDIHFQDPNSAEI